MKPKYLASLIVSWLLFAGANSFYAYQHDGFINYQEDGNELSATCQGQCIIVGENSFDFNTRDIVGEINGQGMMAAGILQGNQFTPTQQRNIQNSVTFEDKVTLNRTESPAVIVFQGNIQFESLTLKQRNLGGIEKLSQSRKQFWTMDTYKPYTINLLYGPRVNGKSALNIFYRLIAIAILIVLITVKKNHNKAYFILGIASVAVLFYDIRMGTEINNYYIHDMQTYIGQEEQNFRDRADLYQYMDQVVLELKKANIETDNPEQISFYSDLQRPVPGAMKYFLYPYTFSTNEHSSETKAFILYGPSNIAKLENQTLTINGEQINGLTIIPIRRGFLAIKL